MPTPQLPSANPDASLAELKDYLIGLNRYLNYLLSSLDTLNISRLDAKVIIADTITAEKLNVTELSAISANLGTITAGIIYGAYIATANGTYPRVEFSSGDNLIKAFYDVDTYISLIPGNGSTIDPALKFIDTAINSAISNGHFSGDQFILLSTKEILIKSATNIRLESSAGNIADLVTAINNLTSTIATKVSSGSSTSSHTQPNHNHGIAGGVQLLDADGVTTHTWVESGGFTHGHNV